MERADQADNFSENGNFLYDDVHHAFVFGVEDVMSVLFEKAFYGGAVFHKGNDDVPVFRRFLLAHHNFVSVADARVDHAGTLYAEHEQIAPVEGVRGEGIVVLIVFVSKYRLTGRDGTDERHIDGRVLFKADRPVFVRALIEITLGAEFFHIIVHGRRGFHVEFGADLAHRGGIAVLGIVIVDKFQNCLQLVFALCGHCLFLLFSIIS